MAGSSISGFSLAPRPDPSEPPIGRVAAELRMVLNEVPRMPFATDLLLRLLSSACARRPVYATDASSRSPASPRAQMHVLAAHLVPDFTRATVARVGRSLGRRAEAAWAWAIIIAVGAVLGGWHRRRRTLGRDQVGAAVAGVGENPSRRRERADHHPAVLGGQLLAICAFCSGRSPCGPPCSSPRRSRGGSWCASPAAS